MEIVNRRIFVKYIKKNRGNRKLIKEINNLVKSIESANWSNDQEIKEARPDADRVHPIGCYFFNISVDRTLVLIELNKDEAKILWCGNHQEYERIFKNNKNTITKWLIERKIIKK